MLLQDNFFSFTAPQTAGNIVTTVLDLNASHKIFEGHFPGQPIVPGVCMVQMVKEVTEKVIGYETRLVKADNIKFLTVIDPTQNKQVQLSIKLTTTSTEQVTVDAQFLNDTTTFFKFKGTFNKE